MRLVYHRRRKVREPNLFSRGCALRTPTPTPKTRFRRPILKTVWLATLYRITSSSTSISSASKVPNRPIILRSPGFSICCNAICHRMQYSCCSRSSQAKSKRSKVYHLSLWLKLIAKPLTFSHLTLVLNSKCKPHRETLISNILFNGS